MKVPRLAKGSGYAGPEHFGCCGTGMRPSIFHSRQGVYVVGPEMRCRDAMRAGISIYQHQTSRGEGRQQIWLYKSRKAAVQRFLALCGQQILDNHAARQECLALSKKAAKGDLAAALALGDY